MTATQGFRQSQSLLHTWSGLLMGWVVFLIFVAGTIAFYREGMNRWMRPELARVEDPMRVLAGAQRFLADKAPDAQTWYINVPSTQAPGAQLFWVPQVKEGERPRRRFRENQAMIAADGTPAQVRDTRGGEFFYRFHFDLHYLPVLWARWLVGLAAAMMLVAILSGVVTHKRIFRDFFTLRRGKGTRSWLDGHNATAVLGLPFHLMITYTGLVSLMAMLMPWAVVANYSDSAKIYEVLYPVAPPAPRTDRPAPLADLGEIVRDAEARLGAPAGFVEVSNPGDAAARVLVIQATSSQLSSMTPRIAYDGVSGRPVWRSPAVGAASLTAGAMIGVHAGRYADAGLRFVYFLCGVAGAVMIASGLVMWTVKRREKLADPARPHFGFRLVERLNVATIGGLPLGIACMLWGNRLLPLGMEARGDREVDVLFMAWGASLLLALVRRPAATWPMLLGTTGVLLAALPFYNALATPAGLPETVARGDWMLAGIDLALIVFGAAFVLLARRVATYRAPVRRVRATRARAAATPAFDAAPEPAE